jgi:hypothetical protein
MFFVPGLDTFLLICPTGNFCITRATTHAVIPGRREAASYDVQLHIRESISPLMYAA